MGSQSLRLNQAALDLLARAAQFEAVWGAVVTNLSYMPYLEGGTSKMPARPTIEPYLAEYQEIVRAELATFLAQLPADPQRAVTLAISGATIAIMKLMSDRTAQPAGPYFTGRAKGSWTARLPGGRTLGLGTPITAEQQRAILRARAIQRRAAQQARARSKK